MPYIAPDRRNKIQPRTHSSAAGAGELNFQLTIICKEYLEYHGKSYQTCNDIVGALENCKNEFQRRIQHPYEDAKINENGDVW